MALDGFDLAVPAGGVDGLLGPTAPATPSARPAYGRFALIWIGVVLGLGVKNQEAAGQLLAVAFPLGMVSSVFTPPSLRTSWLGAIAMWNPVSSALAVRRFHRQRR